MTQNPNNVPLFEAICQLWCFGYHVNFEQLCGKFDIDYELPSYQFDLEEILPDQNVLNSRNNSIYKQNWKFVTSLAQNNINKKIDNFEPILYLTNNKSFNYFSNNKNVITVLLTNNKESKYSKISNLYYKFNANKEMLKIFKNDIGKIPRLIIYHFDEIKGIIFLINVNNKYYF